MKGKVSVIIPAYNESRFIQDTINGIKDFSAVGEIIVIDDGSTDKTGELAAELGANVYKNPTNMGKGASLNIGVSLAKEKYILFLDGDLGLSSWEGSKLWQPLQQGEADCVIAKFPRAKKKGGFGLVKKLAKWAVKKFANYNLDSVLSGQRALTRPALEAILPLGAGFGVELKSTLTLLEKDFRVKEIPVGMTHRETGRDLPGFLHRGKQFKDIFKIVIAEVLK